MRPVRALAAMLSGAVLVVGCLGAAGCTSSQTTGGHSPGTSQVASSDADPRSAADSVGISRTDVAAVVDGTVITQDEVDARVWQRRSADGLTSEESYESYLQSAGITAWDVRRDAIEDLVRDALVEKDAASRGITVSDAEVDADIDQLRSRYPSEGAWLEALGTSGYDEDSYRRAIRSSMLTSRLRAAVVPDEEPTQTEVAQYAVAFAPTLAGRRSSMILFSQDDHELAEQVYQQLQDGADFAEMAREYSIDGSAPAGGDVGWDSLGSFDPAYQEALDQLEPGEMSPIVQTRFGYHIILCTDRYEPTYEEDGSVDLADIPGDLMARMVDSMRSSLAEQRFSAYLSTLLSKVTLAVFDEDGNQVPISELGVASGESTVDAVLSEASGTEDHVGATELVPDPEEAAKAAGDAVR